LADIDCTRKQRQDRTAFKTLIATPATGAFQMPANGRLAFKSRAGCAAGTTAATLNSRSFKTPLLAAGARTHLEYVGRGVTVTPQTGFDVLLDNGLGHYVKIAGA
jgi:hypothetical protein